MPNIAQPRGAARATEPTVGPWLEFDLEQQLEQLRQEPYWQDGHNSKTLAHYEDLRLVLTALQADTKIQEHRTAGRLVVQVLRGHMHLQAGGLAFDLPAGRMLALDQMVPYELHATEDSAVLLTVVWPDGAKEK